VSKIFKNSVIYSVVSILQRAIGFFLLPVYTIYLTPHDYGVVSIVTTLISLLSVLYGLSLHGAANRFYFKYQDDKKKLEELWGTLFTFTVINCLLMTIIIVIFHNYLIDPFIKGISFYPYIIIGLVSVTLNPVYIFFQTTLQTKQNAKKYAVNNFLFFLINIVLILFFVIFLKWKAEGVLIAQALTNVFFYIYTLFVFIPSVKICLNKEFLKESLAYSLPLLPHSIAAWVSAMIDRVLLNNYCSTADVGVYNIGFQFANILNIIIVGVNQAYSPWFFEQIKNEDNGYKRISKFASTIMSLYVFIGLIIILFSSEIILLLNTSYSNAWKVIPFLTVAFIFSGIYYLVCAPFFVNKTYLIPIVTISGAVLTLLLNVILIKKYSIAGAALANLIGSIIIALLTSVLSNKIIKVGFNWFQLFSLPIIMVFSASLFFYFQINYDLLFFDKLLLLIVVTIAFLLIKRNELCDIFRYIKELKV